MGVRTPARQRPAPIKGLFNWCINKHSKQTKQQNTDKTIKTLNQSFGLTSAANPPPTLPSLPFPKKLTNENRRKTLTTFFGQVISVSSDSFLAFIDVRFGKEYNFTSGARLTTGH
jgi:hypothetical protein